MRIAVAVVTILFIGVSSMSEGAQNRVLKYGYVPLTFPRDPADVNLFTEHIILGQILEPLVDTDSLGNVTPGVAKSWRFSDDGRVLTLTLDSDRVFSNGQKITSADAKYTLVRMIEKKSQSSNFLASVKNILAPTSETVVINLVEPNVAILKALSRDQLGLVPSGWTFDRLSKNPFVGSGPYSLKLEKSGWHLIANERYQGGRKPIIKKWELVFMADQDGNIPEVVMPDYAPAITSYAKKKLESKKIDKDLEIREQLSFAQTSAWWHPSGPNFKSIELRTLVMTIVERLMDEGARKMKLERATGVIPKGVAGHASGSSLARANIVSSKKKDLIIKIGLVGSIFDEIISHTDMKELIGDSGLQIDFVKVAPNQVKDISLLKVDVICAGWAGGFNDPEGFIAILPTYLGKNFVDYIDASLGKIYRLAQIEQNWTDRAELFKTLNQKLRADHYMVPGWKIPFYIAGKRGLVSSEATYRYTPRLQLVTEHAK